MSVSQKTLSVLLLTVIVLMVVLYGVAKVSTLSHFSRLEEDEVRDAADRARNELNDATEAMARTTDDYATWDTMYALVKDRSVEGIAREFQDGTLQGLRVNLVMVLDATGHPLYVKKYDFLRHTEVKVSPEVQTALVTDTWVQSARSRPGFGFLQLEDTPVLIAACPILKTSRTGPSRGTLIMAANFDLNSVPEPGRLTRAILSAEPIRGNKLAGDSAQAVKTLAASGEDFWINPLDDNNIAAYTILKDVQGTRLLLLRVTEDRRIYQRGLTALRTFVVGLGLAGVIFSLATLLLLKVLVLSRLTTLNLEIQRIEKEKDISHPLIITGDDEIAEVGKTINHMLEALQKSESALHLLADHIHQVFWVKDAVSLQITYVSPAYQNIWERPCESLYADPDSWREAVYQVDAPLVEQMLESQEEGDQGEIEFRIVRPGGGISWIWGRYFPIVDKEGSITQYISLMEEITEYKTAEEVLLDSQRELWDAMVQRRERLQTIGSLAAGIAHEIKTPTQFVGDNVRYLRESFSPLVELLDKYDELYQEALKGKVSQKFLSGIQAAREKTDLEFLRQNLPSTLDQTLEGITRVADIASAMKEFSHRDLDQQQPNVDLNHALETTIIIARNEWKYVAEIETSFGNLPLIACRPGELNQVFLNLLVNAAHAIGEKVKGTQKKGLIHVSTRADNDWVEVSVSDTGVGIPDSLKTRVFEPFFTTKRAGKGTGQGLALAQTLVEKHGGTLRFETTVGKGSTFHVRVPVAGVPVDAAEAATAK